VKRLAEDGGIEEADAGYVFWSAGKGGRVRENKKRQRA
jgi:membrane-bound inhibitor of C-type lysozyme